jgi:cobalt-zinc-cadmium efflux system outer membrane protein
MSRLCRLWLAACLVTPVSPVLAQQSIDFASVTLAVPLFDRNRSGTAKAIGEERAATAERDATALRLASEATALIRTAQTLSERSARASRELIAPADAVRNAARAAFREGTADVLKLIDAERVYADVRRTELEVRLDALAATLEARFAIGEETLP